VALALNCIDLIPPAASRPVCALSIRIFRSNWHRRAWLVWYTEGPLRIIGVIPTPGGRLRREPRVAT
jgi:hypothetical protein